MVSCRKSIPNRALCESPGKSKIESWTRFDKRRERFPEKAQKQQQNDLILIIGNCAMRIAINADANYAGENA